MPRIIISILLFIVVSYVALSLYLFFFQNRFVYFPHKHLVLYPDSAGLPWEAVTCKTADGVQISAWYIAHENPLGVILFCHGNAGNTSHRLYTIKTFFDMGLSIFIFDYRGYGQSGGKASEPGTHLDAEAAWSFLAEKKNIAGRDIIVFGESLGGAVGTLLAKEKDPRALIILSSFTSIDELGGDLYPYLPIRWLCRIHYPTIKNIRSVQCPILIIHSPDDEIIPFRHGQKLFQAAPAPKEFLQIRGSHNDGFLDPRFERGIKDFLARISPKHL